MQPVPGASASIRDGESKVLSSVELAARRDSLDRAGRRLVFTNGCFDLLHVGHVRYLQGARRLGDALAIGLNADVSVRALKGAGRPLNNEADRAEVLAALACVDFVVIFREPRATRLLEAVRPHVYAKGADYRPETLNPEEKAALAQVGARIEFVPLVPGRSTSLLIQQMQDGASVDPTGQRLTGTA